MPAATFFRIAAITAAAFSVFTGAAVQAQRLEVVATPSFTGSRDVPVHIDYRAAPGVAAFDFELTHGALVSTSTARVSAAIPGATTQCNVLSGRRIRCVALADVAGADLASGRISVLVDASTTAGDVVWAFGPVHFANQAADVLAGTATGATMPLSNQPSLTVADILVDEGTGGTRDATFVLQLSAPAPAGGAWVDVETVDGSARAPGDFTRVATRIPFAAGERSASVSVPIVTDADFEADEQFSLVVRGAGAVVVADGDGVATIRNDDVQVGPFYARADRFIVRENAGSARLAILANDVFDSPRLAGGSISVVGAPDRGSVSIDPGASATTVADDQLVFAVPADWSGRTSLVYRLCESAGRCVQASVEVVVTSFDPAALAQIDVSTSKGNLLVPLQNLRALQNVRFIATALQAPTEVTVGFPLDTTPDNLWDASSLGVTSGAMRHPAGAAPRAWRLLVDARSPSAGDVDLYVGVDSNGDGLPQASELRCASAMSAASERCELRVDTSVEVPTVAYWIAVHGRGAIAGSASVEAFPVALVPGDASLVASGPATLAKGEAHQMRLTWDDATMNRGLARVGYVQAVGADGSLDWAPVRFQRRTAFTTYEPARLKEGAPLKVGIPGSSPLPGLFFDIPAGVDAFTVTTTSPRNVDLFLVQDTSPASSYSSIQPAPSISSAAAFAATPGGNETATVSNPAPGRWYAVIANRTNVDHTVEVLIRVDGTGVRFRRGSYFNPNRPGHGLFLYPAGTQWAGLWYTYLEDGTPTWYYLQGQTPGANGQWRGTIFRSAWQGAGNVLTPIGDATATLVANDDLRFSYNIDGESGSERLSAFGFGCPTTNGTPVDASGLWFDPRRAGTGYSVQLFPNYEFYAAFGYDANGVARFVTAELPRFGAAVETIPMTQQRGFCPLCNWTGSPIRTTVGSLTRTINANQLQRIQINAPFAAPLRGAWNADDQVEPLGDRQGCAR